MELEFAENAKTKGKFCFHPRNSTTMGIEFSFP